MSMMTTGKLLYGTMPEKFSETDNLKVSYTGGSLHPVAANGWYMTVCIPMERIRLYGSGESHPFMRSSIYDNISENDDRLISRVHFIDSNDRIFYAETCIKAGGSDL